jgi:cobalt-zinc-cadmium efflux system protein
MGSVAHNHSHACNHSHVHSHSHAHLNSHPDSHSHAHIRTLPQAHARNDVSVGHAHAAYVSPSSSSNSDAETTHKPLSASGGCCGGHGDDADSLGWRQYLPHSHGLEARLAADMRTLLLALAMLSFTCGGQLLAGFFASSSALVAEAVHSALDGLTVVLSLVAVMAASRPPTPRYSYGFARAETLSALVSVSALALLCVKLLVGAVRNLTSSSPAPPVSGIIVFVAEAVTLASNMTMAWVVTHGSSRAAREKRRGRFAATTTSDLHVDLDLDASVGGGLYDADGEEASLNMRALRAHIIADSLENVVVLLAGAIMWAVPGLSLVDPLVTIAVVCVLIWANCGIMCEAVSVLLQATPRGLQANLLASALSRIKGVASCGPIHVWTLTSGRVVGTAVVLVRASEDVDGIEAVRADVRRVLNKMGVGESTVEVRREKSAPRNKDIDHSHLERIADAHGEPFGVESYGGENDDVEVMLVVGGGQR